MHKHSSSERHENSTVETFKQNARPGWAEILVGLGVMAVLGYGLGSQLSRFISEPVLHGLIFTALSGIAGLAGFFAAYFLRIRSLPALGVRRVSGKWLLIGALSGILAFIIKGAAIIAYISITGHDTNPQDVYAAGADGGLASIILATIFLGILTPIGEEFLFRGIVTNALLKYGALTGVIGSTIIFALMHGINMILPAALVAGLFTAELFRRSGSVWPGVVLHVVFNLPTIPVMLLAASQQ